MTSISDMHNDKAGNQIMWASIAITILIVFFLFSLDAKDDSFGFDKCYDVGGDMQLVNNTGKELSLPTGVMKITQIINGPIISGEFCFAEPPTQQLIDIIEK